MPGHRGRSRRARSPRTREAALSARLWLPLAVASFDPTAADDIRQMLVAPRVAEIRLGQVGTPIVHPSPKLLAGAIDAFEERLDLIGVSPSFAGVARVDDKPVIPLADAMLRQQPVEPIGIGQLALVDERSRVNAQGLELVGRQRHGARLGCRAIELELDIVERAGRLLFEGRRAVDHDDLGRLEATDEGRERDDQGESNDGLHGVSFASGASSMCAIIRSTMGPIGIPLTSPMLMSRASPPSSRWALAKPWSKIKRRLSG